MQRKIFIILTLILVVFSAIVFFSLSEISHEEESIDNSNKQIIYTDSIEGIVKEIYVAKKINIPSSIVPVEFNDGEKRILMVSGLSLDDEFTLESIVKSGKKVMKHTNSDTLNIIGVKKHRFIIFYD